MLGVSCPVALEKHEGNKGHDRSDDSEGDGGGDFLGAKDGGVEGREVFAETGVDILAGDDRVIHDDSQHDDEAEEAHRVRSETKVGHQDHPSGKGYGDSEHHPKGEHGTEEYAENDENQDPTDHERIAKSREAAPDAA